MELSFIQAREFNTPVVTGDVVAVVQDIEVIPRHAIPTRSCRLIARSTRIRISGGVRVSVVHCR